MKTRTIHLLKYLCMLIPCIMIVSSCGDDDPDDMTPMTTDPIASFQFEVSADNYAEVSFTNFSQNATVYSWDFGDGNSSEEENPTHIYAAGGDYDVTLTASNAAGTSATRTESLSLTDPNSQLTLLAGASSKTWYLQREGIALGVGPAMLDNGWWSFGGVTPLAERPCILDDSYTFHVDGTFEANTNGTLFIDNVTNGGWVINGEDVEGCHDESEGGLWGDNDDRADFGNGGDYTYDYDNVNNTLVLNGSGAYIGLATKTGDGDNTAPIQSKQYTVTNLVDGDVADTLHISIVGADFGWNFYLVSYDNAADLPAIPTDVPVFGVDLPDTTPTGMFRSFSGTADADWALLDTITSGSGIIYGVDDPAGGTAQVGEFIRTSNQFQELQFQTAPDKLDINFANLTTVKLDVYIPSTNDYSGSLTTGVIIGLADFSQTAQWWTDHVEYSDDGSTIPLDEWTTLTYSLDAPNAGASAQNPFERNDLDMIYISIGGGDHTDEGTFYVRNLSFE